MSSKASYTRTTSQRTQQSSNLTGLMLGLLRNEPDFDISDYIGTYYNSSGEAFKDRYRAYRRHLGSSANPSYSNPIWTTKRTESPNDVNRFIYAADINILPTDFLQVTLRGGVDTYNDKRIYFHPIGTGGNVTGRFDEDILRSHEVNFDAIARANFNLNSDIGLVATAGWNINDRRFQSNSSDLVGFQANVTKQTVDLNAANEASDIKRFRSHRRTNRGYGTLNFDLYDQLYVNVGGAIEASSTANKTFAYPSADVAWQFTELASFSNKGPLSFGKFRLSWGKVGVAPPVHVSQTLAEGGFSHYNYSAELDIRLFGGGKLNDNFSSMAYNYDAYDAADFMSGGIENADGLSNDKALIREIVEERYVSGFGTLMPFDDARRLRKSDSDVAVPIPFNVGTASAHPERMPYADTELNTSSNGPVEDPGIFTKTEVNQ